MANGQLDGYGAPLPGTILDGWGQPLAAGGVGSKVLTVGAGGQYATIQEAIDTLTFEDCFESVARGWMPATVASWAVTESTVATSSMAYTGLTDPLFKKNRVWLQAAGDTFMYRITAFSTITLDEFHIETARAEADVVGTPALSYWVEHPVTILLLDDYVAERVDISTAISVRFDSVAGTRWTEANPDAAAQACITFPVALPAVSVYFGSGVTVEGSINSTAAPDACETGVIEFERGSVYSIVLSDGFGLFDFGALTIRGDLVCSATAGPAHVMQGDLNGDLVFDNMSWLVYALDAAVGINYDAFAGISCRKLIINGMKVTIDDPGGRLDSIQLFGLDGECTHDIHASGIEVTSKGIVTTPVQVFDENASDCSAITATLALHNCSIDTSFCTNAATSIFNTTSHANGSARVVKAVNCGGGLIDKPAAAGGALTVTHQGLGAAATNGAQTATLTNLPAAATAGDPSVWKKVLLDDGTTGYVPVWK